MNEEAVPSIQIPPFEEEQKRHFRVKKWEIAVAAVALFAIGGVLFYMKKPPPGVLLPKREYSQTFLLVADKISQSASIAIHLPKGVNIAVADAKEKISFEPAVKGEWIAGKQNDELLFRPQSKLEQGKYYTAILAAADTKLQKDFFVDEDPKIVSVFPRPDSEAPETSEVTIVFNRPMVPLTTLDILSEKEVPVVIVPPTPGKFKWITTRNLQFIPEQRLQRSSHYIITIKEGLTSMDGLPVSTITHKFITRPLRYEGPTLHRGGMTLYREPVRIRFNQPVDLEKTKSYINVTKIKNKERIPVVVEYGHRAVYEEKTKTTRDALDKSILEIYGARDRHGREKFWDFDTAYELAIARAIPFEGDIDLSEKRSALFQVPEVIADLSADSPRSARVEPGVFDPEGKLWVSFHEDIDKNRSDIKAKNLKEIGYGEQCRRDSDGNEILIGSECEKIPDQKQLWLKFNPTGFKRAEALPVEFRKIVNTAGLTLNAETIVKTLTTYPELRITKTVPSGGTGKLTEMKICTTSPLAPATEKNFYEWVQSNVSVGKWNWGSPFRIGEGFKNTPCALGEFENTVDYGLIPESFYRITLRVEDDFGQKTERSVEFTSEKISEIYRRFDHLQKAYNVTTPERTKLTYAVENLEYVNLHICETDAPTMLRYLDFDTRPDEKTPGGNLSCLRTFTKRVELPKKYWTKNYFQINLKDFVPGPLGHYVFSFSHPEYREQHYDYRSKQYLPGGPIYERTFLTVTNLAIQEKKIERGEFADRYPEFSQAAFSRSNGNLYWITEAGSLKNIEGARVDLYQKVGGGLAKAVSRSSDRDGVARTPVVADAVAAVVVKGGDSAIVSSNFDKFQWASSARSALRSYIYTDRPIYRPGQEVFIKGLYRVGYDGEYSIARDKQADIEVFNSNNESILKKSLEFTEYGTFTANLILDTKAPLGTYRISTLEGNAYFDVEEYVPSPFKLDLSSAKEEYIAGDTFSLGVDAHYYFGVPLEGGEVTYSILAQDYHFDRYQDGYFQFGAGWYYSSDGQYGDKFILRGKEKLDEKGRAVIERPIDFQKFFRDDERDRSKIFVVNVTARNTTGQTVSQQKSFVVHRGEYYLGTNLEKRYFAKGAPNKFLLKSVDVKGKEMPVQNIAVEINKIKWESFKRQEVDGRYYYRTEKKKESIRRFTVKTDSKGNYSQNITIDQEGEFEIFAHALDSHGNQVSSVTDFYVYGAAAVSVRPTNNETLDLAVEKNRVNVGEEITLIIKSPYQRAKALITVERGQIFDYAIVDVDRNLVNYTFRVKEAYIPNVFVSVLLLSPRPEVKYGQVQFFVNTKEKEMTIFVTSGKNHYLPGEEVKLNVETRDSRGKPIPAEVSIAVADVSVLALKGNPKKNPIAFFYAGLPLAVTTASNIKNILYEAEIPAGTKGGGGLEPEDLAKKKRGEFKDTAFWRGVVRTGEDGKAEVSFTLPDNLTTWQTEVVGITKDTKVGAGYSEFIARKEIMAVPLRPRFVIPGDEFMIGAKIFNQTDSAQRLDVSLASKTLELKNDTRRSITIAPRAAETLYFATKAPEKIQDGAHAFVVSAKNGVYEDTVENSIAIKRNDTYESVATAYFTTDATAREYMFLPDNVVKDKGGVTIKTSATLAVFLSDALNYLVSYPYGCSEQIASKLSSIAIVKRGLNLKNVGDKFVLKDIEFEGQRYSLDDVVAIGLSRIYSNQTASGGFAYYPELKPDFHLTLHVMNTLEDMRRAGYAVNAQTIDRAARYLYQQIVSDPYLSEDRNSVILTAYSLGRLDSFLAENSLLRGKIIEIMNDKKFIREDIANISLAYLSMLLTKGYASGLKAEAMKVLENRVTIDGRGAFIPQYRNQMLAEYYETPIKDTALFLKSLVVARSENPVIDKVLRWLLRSRAKDGAWGSTNNTVSVVDAFTDYLEWRRETESEFSLSVALDGKEKKTFDFNRDTILNTFDLFLPTSDFAVNKVSTLDLKKTNGNNLPNAFYYDMLFQYFLPINSIPPRDEGFGFMREFFRLDDKENKNPLIEAKVGDVLRGHLTIVVPKNRNFVAIEDFIPAGMEIVNLKLATEDQSLKEGRPNRGRFDGEFDGEGYFDDGHGSLPAAPVVRSENPLRHALSALLPFGGLGGGGELRDDEYNPVRKHALLFPDAEESHDDRLFLFNERLSPGVYEFDYFVRALIPGMYHHLPAVVSEMYFPENFGRTRGEYFVIAQ